MAVAALIGGCGDGDDGAAVRTLFYDLRLSQAIGDYPAVCSQMHGAAKRQVAEMGHGPPLASCPRGMSERLAAVAPRRRDRIEPRIVDVTIDGDRATLTAALSGGPPTAIRFVKDDGRWQLEHVFHSSGPPAIDMQ